MMNRFLPLPQQLGQTPSGASPVGSWLDFALKKFFKFCDKFIDYAFWLLIKILIQLKATTIKPYKGISLKNDFLSFYKRIFKA